MAYEVELITVAPIPLAAVPGRVNTRNIAQQIPALLGEVWKVLKVNPLGNVGINVVFYDISDDDCDFTSEAGVPIQAGVQLAEPLPPGSPLIGFKTPAGRTAHVTHVGCYSLLKNAHEAIHKWSRQNGQLLAGPNWEVYGHWTENEAELRTDVYYLLK